MYFSASVQLFIVPLAFCSMKVNNCSSTSETSRIKLNESYSDKQEQENIAEIANDLQQLRREIVLNLTAMNDRNDKLFKRMLNRRVRSETKKINNRIESMNNKMMEAVQQLQRDMIDNLTVAMNKRIDDMAAIIMNKTMMRLEEKSSSLQQNTSQTENFRDTLQQMQRTDQNDNDNVKTSEHKTLQASE